MNYFCSWDEATGFPAYLIHRAAKAIQMYLIYEVTTSFAVQYRKRSDYAFDATSRPINPIGRTGLRGRGVLGRWGPNHAADPLVTRIKNDKLQFVAIKRGDTGEWAIPGGMVDAGEQVSDTLKREFSEETLGGKARAELEQLWSNGRELYRGYVDDHRNTDNAWMETTCVNFHDTTGLLDEVELQRDSMTVELFNVTFRPEMTP
ncbi:hydrolase, NUDIX family [Ancylostoma ceylanicum]|uniref:Hydrolase, NUDIX family n=1 Tax=Ancylostoma ceylanicum TaxID=53326 RepID=A0A0D6LQ77_9BILA|nr:hydrolase, NUDIX family [Ancylostoma ceylanicum]